MASQDLSYSNFGLLIAYIIPGFTALNGLPGIGITSRTVNNIAGDQSIAALLSSSLEALFAGLTVSTVRWLILDTIHHRFGIRAPAWDFATLEKRSHAFEIIVSHQYHYYKFYSNMVVALLWAYCSGAYAHGLRGLLYFPLIILFFLGSRDTLKKYYQRTGQLLASQR